MACPSQFVAKWSSIVIFAYGDESMDETFQRVCAVAAIIGTENQWKYLEDRWLERTKNIPFHANECDTDHGIYSSNPHEENKALYRDLVTILAESELKGYAAVIDLLGMAEVYPSPTIAHRMYFRGLLEVVEGMSMCAGKCGELAELTFDSRQESDHNAGLMYAHLRENNLNWKTRLAPKLSFNAKSKDEANARLESADIFAREAMKDLDNKIGPNQRKTRLSWTALENTKRFALEIFDKKHFQGLEAEFDRSGGWYKQALAGYPEWLRAKNKEDNLTNYFEYQNTRWSKVKAIKGGT